MIHYNTELNYQKDSKFIAVGYNSIKRMHVLLEAGGYLFVHKDSSGFVFNQSDVEKAKDGDNILPVMVVKLRDSGIEGFKQAHGLRIREYFADESVCKTWYRCYIDQVAPIVSDQDHLQGGYLLWKHHLKLAASEPKYTITAINVVTKEVLFNNLTIENYDESALWSQYPDTKRKNVVLMMRAED